MSTSCWKKIMLTIRLIMLALYFFMQEAGVGILSLAQSLLHWLALIMSVFVCVCVHACVAVECQ